MTNQCGGVAILKVTTTLLRRPVDEITLDEVERFRCAIVQQSTSTNGVKASAVSSPKCNSAA
jgi:hypothetical protein